ncbi:MAG TPA: cytochrome c oxidase subunit II [Blastocatellia bacterium]|nr:cytochrome c oxidase subunit II [Blastocatellia bacterium]
MSAIKMISNVSARRYRSNFATRLLLSVVTVFICATFSYSQPAPDKAALIRSAHIDQHLNQQVPLNLVFRDEQGHKVHLQDYFNGKPVILSLVYYQCPMLCTVVLNAMTESMSDLRFDIGKEFNVITVSFDPNEGPALAADKKELYVRRYGRAGAASGWHFLTGEESQIKQLAEAVGFNYAYDPSTGQYAHASGIMVLTPDGRLARYFYGIKYPPSDLRLGLVEASAGKIGSPVDQILLLCYHYDAATGKYTPIAIGFMRLGGAITLVGLVGFIVVMWRHDVKKKALTHSIVPLFLIPQLIPETASTEAHKVDIFFYLMVLVCGFVAVGVITLIIIFAVKYRRKSEDQLAIAAPQSMPLEITWIVIPLFIFIGMFVWGTDLYFSLARPPQNAIEVYVVGKQWMWKFQHPEGQREINQLHVPLGRPIKLTMASQDVIHDLYVPAFRIHTDVVPGRYTTTWFQATKPGTYHLFCSQYCGTLHSGMIGEVIVMQPDDYLRWLNQGGEGSLASQGQKLFRQLGCNACHTGDAEARCPSLIGLYGRTVYLQSGNTIIADDDYIRESIMDPQAKIVAGFQPIMPTFRDQLDQEQVLELISYIRSLGAQRQEVPPVSAPTGPQPAPVQGAIQQSESKGGK